MRKRQTTSTPTPIQPSELQLLDIPAAAKLLSIGRTSVYALINDGQLKTVKLKSSTRIPVTALQELIQRNQQAS